MRIAINGMGRIGRLLFRRLMNHPQIEVVAINDIMDTDNLVYLLRHDSVYGNLQFPLAVDKNIIFGDVPVTVLSEPDPLQLPWKKLGIDIVLECTGKFTTKALASKHLDAGAKKVLLSTTGSEDVPLMIFGFNQQVLTEKMNIISPGGCMTNCATNVLNLMNGIGFESVHLNVIHSYTSRQELVDAPHKDFRRGRAAAESIIPVQVDLAQSLERLFPLMKNKIAAVTTRVPVINGALADFTFHLKEDVTKEQINALFSMAALQEYKGILEYTKEPLVSLDIKGNTHSAIIDGMITSLAGKQVKLFAFFDNEYGYTSRIIDWILYWKEFTV